MSKRAIQQLLDSNIATLRLNKFCVLRRRQIGAHGEQEDELDAVFSITHVASHIIPIKAREPQEILKEVADAQTEAFTEAAARMNKDLLNGYNPGGWSGQSLGGGNRDE